MATTNGTETLSTFTDTIDGVEYRFTETGDRDCPLTMSRIYQPGEIRSRFIGLEKVSHQMQADGSWLKIPTRRGWSTR